MEDYEQALSDCVKVLSSCVKYLSVQEYESVCGVSPRSVCEPKRSMKVINKRVKTLEIFVCLSHQKHCS